MRAFTNNGHVLFYLLYVMNKLTLKLSLEKLGFYQELLLKCSPKPRRRNKYMHGLRNDIYKISVCFSPISVSRTNLTPFVPVVVLITQLEARVSEVSTIEKSPDGLKVLSACSAVICKLSKNLTILNDIDSELSSCRGF